MSPLCPVNQRYTASWTACLTFDYRLELLLCDGLLVRRTVLEYRGQLLLCQLHIDLLGDILDAVLIDKPSAFRVKQFVQVFDMPATPPHLHRLAQSPNEIFEIDQISLILKLVKLYDAPQNLIHKLPVALNKPCLLHQPVFHILEKLHEIYFALLLVTSL